MHEALHHFCLGVLESRLAGDHDAVAAATKVWAPLVRPIFDRFAPAAARLEDIRARTLGVTSLSDRLRTESWRQAGAAFEAHFMGVLEWIYRWSGVVEGTQELLPLPWLLPLPEVLRDKARAPGHAAFRRSRRSYKPKPSRLREVLRIPLGTGPEPLHPHCISFHDGRLFVSLNRGHEVLEVQPEGGVLRRIAKPKTAARAFQRPAGIAFDDVGRLWVVDAENRSVEVLDLDRGAAYHVPPGGDSPWQDGHPFGIGRMADGAMLVSDSGNGIVRFRPDGSWDTLVRAEGTGLGEFRHPTQLSPGLEGSLWVVDRNNHRVQRVDPAGRCVQAIGRCGLGRDALFAPESVAQFEDGAVAVAQNRWNRCLKLFTPEGAEFDRTPLTCFAQGMWVHRGRLYVAAMDQDSILVYEREP